jgi:small subunit ribosomal protein S1
MVSGFDRSKKPNFSVKALQIAEEKQAVAQYGSSDSGASLGDILGAALKEKAEASAKDADKDSAKAEKKTKKK